MKINKKSKVERLQDRILKMQYKEEDIWIQEKSRLYPFCKHCGITNVCLDIEGDHYKSCPFRGWTKQIKHYKKLLEEILKQK